MKRRVIAYMLIWGLVPALSTTAWAQQESDQKDETRKAEQKDDKAEKADKPDPREMDPLQAETRFLQELRDAALEEIDFSDAQRKYVAKIFDEHLKDLKRIGKEEDKTEPDPEQIKRINQLEREARAARHAGDIEEARRIHRQIRQLRRETISNSRQQIHSLHRDLQRKLRDEFSDEQLRQFRRLVREMRVRKGARDPWMRFGRSIRRAMMQLELDREQRKLLDDVVRGIRKQMHKPDDQADSIEDVKQKLHDQVARMLGDEVADQFIDAVDQEMQKEKRREKRREKREEQKPQEDAPEDAQQEPQDKPQDKPQAQRTDDA